MSGSLEHVSLPLVPPAFPGQVQRQSQLFYNFYFDFFKFLQIFSDFFRFFQIFSDFFSF